MEARYHDDSVHIGRNARSDTNGDNHIGNVVNIHQTMEGKNAEKQVLRFKDAVGRKFSIPFTMVKTWQGMEEVVQQAFIHVEIIGPHVQQGHYDLVGPNGEIILPSTWEHLVEPGWSVSMHMWPMPTPKPARGPAPIKRPPLEGPPGINIAHPKREKDSARRHTTARNDPDSVAGDSRPAKKPSWPYLSGAARPSQSFRPGLPALLHAKPADGSVGSSRTSTSTSVDDKTSWEEALEKGLLVVTRIPNSASIGDGMEQAPTKTVRKGFPFLEQLEFIAARVSCEGPVWFDRASLELQLPDQQPLEKRLDELDMKRMTWLHVTRKIMDFNEFKEIAISRFSTDLATSSAVSQLFHSIESKKTNEQWYIQPGTVLRCDMKHEVEPDVSAIFISVPSLHPDPISKSSSKRRQEGVCPEKMLCDIAESVSSSFEHNKNQQFRKHEGAKLNQVLWIRQTWILVAGSVLLTYGSLPREALEADNISTWQKAPPSKDEPEMLQLMDDDRNLYYVPADKCKSFYELQVAVKNELLRRGKDDVIDDDLHFEIPGGPELTARQWPTLLKKGNLQTIKISLRISSNGFESRGYESPQEDDEDSSSSLDESTVDGNKDGIKSKSRIRPSGSVHFITGRNADGFISEHEVHQKEDVTLDIPELNKSIAPFLRWASPADKSKDASKEFEKKVLYIETDLIRGEGDQASDVLVKELYQSFDHSIYQETTSLNPSEFERRRRAFFKGNMGADDRINSLVEEYFDLSTTIFEAFISTDYVSSLVTKFYRALEMVMDDLDRDAFLHDSKPGSKAVVENERLDRWVVSRSRTREGKLLHLSSKNDKCRDCERGTVYHSKEGAIAHLHISHSVGSKSDESLHAFLVSLPVAAEERLKEDHIEILQLCRDTMAAVLAEVVSIQDGVVDDQGAFRDPQRGVPYAIVDSFKLLVAFVCAVPRILDESYDYYTNKVPQRRPKALASSKARAQRRTLSKVGSAALDMIKDAEEKFRSPTDTPNKGNVDIPCVSVGLHYVAAHIVCNIIRMPVHNHKKVAQLYEGYSLDMAVQVIRLAKKQQIEGLGALMHELLLITEFTDWQAGVLSSLQLVLDPGTRFRVGTDEFFMEEDLLVWQTKQLSGDQEKIADYASTCEVMINKVDDRMQKSKDQDQSDKVSVPNILAIVLLCLCLIAWYSSISSSATNSDTSAIQSTFWKTASLFTFALGAFCLGAANQRQLLHWWDH